MLTVLGPSTLAYPIILLLTYFIHIFWIYIYVYFNLLFKSEGLHLYDI
jgi:hypothetical protein